MDIAVELSLYPLNADYIPPIKDFIDRLNADGNLKVVTNSLSTQVFGPYEAVLGADNADAFAGFVQRVVTSRQSNGKREDALKEMGRFVLGASTARLRRSAPPYTAADWFEMPAAGATSDAPKPKPTS